MAGLLTSEDETSSSPIRTRRQFLQYLWPRRRGQLLLLLLLLTAVPRMAMAWRLDSYCNDGYYYLYVADELDRGNTQPLRTYLNLNVYPMILVAGHRLGLAWETVAEGWGVLAGSLLVLPLFGWVRHLFSLRTACFTCLIYAVHPEFIELAPEPIRDTTFWLFLVCTIYCGLRASRSGCLRWFVCGGIAWTLAIHTRSEGWLLAVPLGIQVAFRYRDGFRRPMILGTAVACSAIPCFLVLANTAVCQPGEEWTYGRLNHFVVGWRWIRTHCGFAEPEPLKTPCCPQSPVASLDRAGGENSGQTGVHRRSQQQPCELAAEQLPPASQIGGTPALQRIPLAERLVRYLKRINDAVEWFSLICLAIGGKVFGRRLWQRDYWPLGLFALLVGAAIWVLYSAHDMTNSRYFLTGFLAISPWAGLGLQRLWEGVRQIHRRRARVSEDAVDSSGSSQGRYAPNWATAFLIGVMAVGYVDALTSQHGQRDREVQFARLLKQKLDRGQGIVVDHDAKRIGFHAENAPPRLVDVSCSVHLNSLAQTPPDALVLSYRRLSGSASDLDAEARKIGLQPADDQLPSALRKTYRLFVRSDRPVNAGRGSTGRTELADHEQDVQDVANQPQPSQTRSPTTEVRTVVEEAATAIQ